MFDSLLFTLEFILTARYSSGGFKKGSKDSNGYNVSGREYKACYQNKTLCMGEYKVMIRALDLNHVGFCYGELISDKIEIVLADVESVTIIIDEDSKLFKCLKPLVLYKLYFTGCKVHEIERMYLSNLFFINCDGEIEEVNKEASHIKLILYTWMLISTIINSDDFRVPCNQFIQLLKDLIIKYIPDMKESFQSLEKDNFKNLVKVMALISCAFKSERVLNTEFSMWFDFLDELDLFDLTSLDWYDFIKITKRCVSKLKGIFNHPIYKAAITNFTYDHDRFNRLSMNEFDINHIGQNFLLNPIIIDE